MRSARVLDGTRWIDIAIDGDPRRAQALCEQMVTISTHDDDDKRLAGRRIARACGPEALSKHAAQGTLLARIEEVDEWELSFDVVDALGEPSAAVPKARGTVTMFTPFASRDECMRVAADIRAKADADRAEFEATLQDLQENRVKRAKENERRMCDDTPQTDEDAVRRCEIARRMVVEKDQLPDLLPPNPVTASCH